MAGIAHRDAQIGAGRQPRQLGQARRNLHLLRRDPHLAALRHRVPRIGRQVDQRRLQLRPVQPRRGVQPGRHLADHADAGAEGGVEQRADLAQRLRHRHRRGAAGGRAGSARRLQQPPGQRGGALRMALQVQRHLPHPRRILGVP
ncbi:MAG: hypothetical protein B7Z44_20545 [Caulobacter sp. 12-67-6]|nr:MAG: hypothetical protein B7Z44_20545 [Caulobacter sp. 12-67-6]